VLLSPLVSFKSRFVTYLLNFPRIYITSQTIRRGRLTTNAICQTLRVIRSTVRTKKKNTKQESDFYMRKINSFVNSCLNKERESGIKFVKLQSHETSGCVAGLVFPDVL